MQYLYPKQNWKIKTFVTTISFLHRFWIVFGTFLHISSVRVISGVQRDLKRHISDVPNSRNWHKTVAKLYLRYMSVSQYTGHIIQTETCDNNTALPLVGVLVTCSGRINDNMSKLKFLRHLWEIVVFRLVVYLLNMINTPNLIQNLTDIHFGIILTQFYINFLRQKHQIELLYVSINPWDSQVSAYAPFHFSFTVTLKKAKCLETWKLLLLLFLPNLVTDRKYR